MSEDFKIKQNEIFVCKNQDPIKIEYMGWTCPKCGRVLSPWTQQCPCSSTNDPPRKPIRSNNGLVIRRAIPFTNMIGTYVDGVLTEITLI